MIGCEVKCPCHGRACVASGKQQQTLFTHDYLMFVRMGTPFEIKSKSWIFHTNNIKRNTPVAHKSDLFEWTVYGGIYPFSWAHDAFERCQEIDYESLPRLKKLQQCFEKVSSSKIFHLSKMWLKLYILM